MKKLLKIFVILLLIGGAGGGAYWWYLRTHPANPLADVITARASRGDIELAVLATGTLRPSRLVAVGAQVSGRVTSLKVKVGQAIKAGDLIAEIDSLPQQNALKTANAALASTRAQLAEKQATLSYSVEALKRAQAAFATHATSRDTLEAADTTVKTTTAQIAALEAQIIEAEVAVQTAEINLGYTRVTAPSAGTVLLVVTQQGQTVNASQSAPTIVVIGQIDTMTVRSEISEADVTRVKPGQSVYFTVLGDPAKRFKATLEAVDPAPDTLRSDSEIATSSSSAASSSSDSSSSAVYYYGRFNVPNPDGFLKTYMTAEVHIILGEAKNAVIVPSSALATDETGKTFVDVVDATGAIQRRDVEIGLNDKVKVEIRSGLQEGEKVVSSRKSGAFVKTFTMRGPGMGM
jgi:macrolide-specific efflux system membrane fusion protein